MEKAKKQFLFNIEWVEVLMDYPTEVRHEVYDAIMEYVASGEISELKPMAKMAFSFIKKEIDYNNAQLQKTVAACKEEGIKIGKARQLTADPDGYESESDKAKLSIYDNDIKKKALTDVSVKEKLIQSLNCKTDEYRNFVEWLISKAPYCFTKLKLPTENEFLKLKSKYTGKQIADSIETIENRQDLRKRYINLYRTLLNWLKNDYG